MPRPIWSGTLSFGLLNVPVQLVTAERACGDISFRMLDGRDKQPIKYQRINAETGKEVPWDQIVKAYEYEKNNYVVIDEKDLKAAKPEAAETIDIEAFVDRDAISPMYFVKPYYLLPGKKAEKGYVLLRDTLKKSGRVGIARFVLRTRQYLAMLMAQDDALVIEVLRFSDEIVEQVDLKLPGDAKTYKITARELSMAEQLIRQMDTKWDPADYSDDFEDKLHKLIEKRIKENGDAHVKLKTESRKGGGADATNVVDFMALLQQSLKKKGGKEKLEPAEEAAPRARAPRASAHAARKTTRKRS